MDSEMDAVLSSIKSTWDRSVILTGDTNIDLLSSFTARHIYKKMLDTYQLYTPTPSTFFSSVSIGEFKASKHARKKKSQEVRQSTETTTWALTGEPNYKFHFLKYAKSGIKICIKFQNLDNQAPKQIQENENYPDVVRKLKKNLSDKILTSSLSN